MKFLFTFSLTFFIGAMAFASAESDNNERWACAKKVFNFAVRQTHHENLKLVDIKVYRRSRKIFGHEFFGTDYKYVEFQATDGTDTYTGTYEMIFHPSTPDGISAVCKLKQDMTYAFVLYDRNLQKVDGIDGTVPPPAAYRSRK